MNCQRCDSLRGKQVLVRARNYIMTFKRCGRRATEARKLGPMRQPIESPDIINYPN